jgi:hypothetical protein
MPTMDYKEKAKIWMKKPNLDENRTKIGENLIEDPYYKCKDILLHCKILYSQLRFTASMEKPAYDGFYVKHYVSGAAN